VFRKQAFAVELINAGGGGKSESQAAPPGPGAERQRTEHAEQLMLRSFSGREFDSRHLHHFSCSDSTTTTLNCLCSDCLKFD